MKIKQAEIKKLKALIEEYEDYRHKTSLAAEEKKRWQDIETKRAKGFERSNLNELSRLEAEFAITGDEELKVEMDKLRDLLEPFKVSQVDAREKLKRTHELMARYQQMATQKFKEITQARVLIQQSQPIEKLDIELLINQIAHESYSMLKNNQLTAVDWVNTFIMDHLLGGKANLAQRLQAIWDDIDAGIDSQLEAVKS